MQSLDSVGLSLVILLSQRVQREKVDMTWQRDSAIECHYKEHWKYEYYTFILAVTDEYMRLLRSDVFLDITIVSDFRCDTSVLTGHGKRCDVDAGKQMANLWGLHVIEGPSRSLSGRVVPRFNERITISQLRGAVFIYTSKRYREFLFCGLKCSPESTGSVGAAARCDK